MRCVLCVCGNFVLDRLRSGFVVVLRCCCGSKIIIVECVSTSLVGYVCEVGKIVLIIIESISVRM